MAMLRMNIPAIFVYGGTIKPGRYKGRDLTIVSPFEAVGEFAAGKMSKEDFDGIERSALPGTGACGGMYTANTMSSAFEALGMSLPYSSTMANPDDEKADSAAQSGEVLVEAIKKQLLPRAHRHAQGDRERDRGGDGGRRLDQRRAAFAGDRARGRRRRGRSTTSSASASACRCCAT